MPKHPNTIIKNKTGLLVIDVQEKFRPVFPQFKLLGQNIAKLIATFQLFNLPVLLTEQYPQGLGPTIDELKQLFPLLEITEKIEFNCMDNPNFVKTLNAAKLDAVVVCGIESHVCVNQTVLALLADKYRVHVVVDAIASRRSIDHEVAIRKMEQAGAIPATTEIVLFELAERAGTESFKTIQSLVKVSRSVKSSGSDAAADAKNLKIAAPGEKTGEAAGKAQAPGEPIVEVAGKVDVPGDQPASPGGAEKPAPAESAEPAKSQEKQAQPAVPAASGSNGVAADVSAETLTAAETLVSTDPASVSPQNAAATDEDLEKILDGKDNSSGQQEVLAEAMEIETLLDAGSLTDGTSSGADTEAGAADDPKGDGSIDLSDIDSMLGDNKGVKT
ncbi:MAG: isochorismatase family protein [Chitinivibrionales bacterium]|nr:isochorismatase family protein [Chitinivibrionales bacterium]